MKHIYKICGKISLLFYVFILYQLWHLCQYGGTRRHIPALMFGIAGFVGAFVLWMIARQSFKRDNFESFRKKNILCRDSHFYYNYTFLRNRTALLGNEI